MKLYGTTTSPYVRRVRALALEVGLPTELVDTATDAGMAALRDVSPIRKVPTARIDDKTLWDSAAITDYVVATRGLAELRPVRDAVAETQLRLAIDGALDAAINVFYLERDGVDVNAVAYTQKQNERVVSCLTYVASSLKGGFCTDDPRFGVTEIALATTLEWFIFRNRYPVDTIPALAEAMAVHRERASLVATRPG
jgi:glutathione S-transferase